MLRKGIGTRITAFAGILQTLERPSKLSRRLCTAEGVGSNPIGSTLKYSDLQVKREGWVETTELSRGLVLQPILQSVFQGAVCAVLHSALLARRRREKSRQSSSPRPSRLCAAGSLDLSLRWLVKIPSVLALLTGGEVSSERFVLWEYDGGSAAAEQRLAS